MAYDIDLAQRLRGALAREEHVTETRSIGGSLSFQVNGHMCCAVGKHGLMVRVGPAAYAATLERPHTQPMSFGGKTPIGYVWVDPAGLSTNADLVAWVRQGLQFVDTLPPSAK